MFDIRTNLSKEVKEELVNFMGDKVFTSIIPRNVDVSEAPSFGKTLQSYAPWCKGAQAYKSLAKEFLQVVQ